MLKVEKVCLKLRKYNLLHFGVKFAVQSRRRSTKPQTQYKAADIVSIETKIVFKMFTRKKNEECTTKTAKQ